MCRGLRTSGCYTSDVWHLIGAVLGPILFVLYTADLISVITLSVFYIICHDVLHQFLCIAHVWLVTTIEDSLTYLLMTCSHIWTLLALMCMDHADRLLLAYLRLRSECMEASTSWVRSDQLSPAWSKQNWSLVVYDWSTWASITSLSTADWRLLHHLGVICLLSPGHLY